MRYSDESPSVFWITFGTFTLRTSSLSDSKLTSADAEDWLSHVCIQEQRKCMHVYLHVWDRFNVLWIIECYSSVKQVKSRKHDKQRTSCFFLNKTHTCRCKLIRFISWMNTNQHYDFMKKSAVYISSQLCTCNRIIPNK